MSGGGALFVHASAVVIGEKGLLIEGVSGAGKSSLAARLIADAGARGHFARLIGDDRVAVRAQAGRLIATGHPAIRGRIERRGLGILRVDWVEHAVIAGLVRIAGDAQRLPEPEESTTVVAGVRLPVLRLALAASAADRSTLVLDWLRA
jgi:HPr kinase/phosphorylase